MDAAIFARLMEYETEKIGAGGIGGAVSQFWNPRHSRAKEKILATLTGLQGAGALGLALEGSHRAVPQTALALGLGSWANKARKARVAAEQSQKYINRGAVGAAGAVGALALANE